MGNCYESKDNIIKGRIAEVIVEELFRDLGFYVIKAGKENSVNPLVQLQSFTKICGGKFFRKKEDYMDLLPDFIIIHPEGQTKLIEVKYRHNGELRSGDKRVFDLFPDVALLIVNRLNDPKKTKFQIWCREDSSKEGGNIVPTTLKIWLSHEFKIEYSSPVKKYTCFKFIGIEHENTLRTTTQSPQNVWHIDGVDYDSVIATHESLIERWIPSLDVLYPKDSH
ncbi:hypothetical protein HZB02_05335 [Candidatus Woesearchaeota archaeon]|nr:hypothetical protein [Candidatus Woesearchaeota archaeon]